VVVAGGWWRVVAGGGWRVVGVGISVLVFQEKTLFKLTYKFSLKRRIFGRRWSEIANSFPFHISFASSLPWIQAIPASMV
jgi:hypothetical protein